jgi:hypothetical protein
MPAFQPYAGAYQSREGGVSWRCYATARIHGVRRVEHGPLPTAPTGKKWIRRADRDAGPAIAWLVDDAVAEFSQILLQIAVDPAACAPEPARRVAAPEAVLS